MTREYWRKYLTISALARSEDEPGVDVVVATAYVRTPYTLLERDATGGLVHIRHRREGDAMPEWGESDMGLFSLSSRAYLALLPEFARGNEPGTATRERNFLPFLPWAARRARLKTFRCLDPRDAVGVNTPEDRALVEAFLRERAAVLPSGAE